MSSTESQQVETLYGILSHRSGYLVVLPPPTGEGTRKASIVRTFLVGSAQNRGELLTREVLVTTALVESAEPIKNLTVFDSVGTVNGPQLAEKLGIEVGTIDLCDAAGAEPQILSDCDDSVDFAIAYGAALSHSEKGHGVNFRDDFSPFQGKKLRLQNVGVKCRAKNHLRGWWVLVYQLHPVVGGARQ